MKFTLVALLAAVATAAPLPQRRGGFRGGPGLGGLGALVGSTIGSGAALAGDLLVGGTVGVANAIGDVASGLIGGRPRSGPVIVVPAGSPYPYNAGPPPYRGWYTEEGEEAAKEE